MSSGEGASQNPADRPIEACHLLLKSRDFLAARFLAHMNNQIVSNKRYDIFEQARAICDVIIAAENRLPNGFMDCYGMIRVNRLGPVILEDFEKLMKLLDKKHNPFPFCEEAAEKASLAWSLLSVPLNKAYYDLTIFPYSQSGEGRVNNGKRKMEYPHRFPDYVIPKRDNVGPTADDEMVVTSDDDDDDRREVMVVTSDDDDDDGREVMVVTSDDDDDDGREVTSDDDDDDGREVMTNNAKSMDRA